jgi:hypothetical protein
MKHFLAVLALSGCSSVVVMQDPCACVVMPTMNGALSMALARQAVTFDGGQDTGAEDTLPIEGFVFWPEMSYASTGVRIAAFSGLAFESVWDEGEELTGDAQIVSLSFQNDVLTGIDFDNSQYYELGPQGGMLRLREIVPGAEGGWRVRGDYRAQICLEDNSGCTTAQGSFAFDAAELPPGAEASGLVSTGS